VARITSKFCMSDGSSIRYTISVKSATTNKTKEIVRAVLGDQEGTPDLIQSTA